MRNLTLILISILLISRSSSAQLVGDNIFLQGHYLEVGIAPNGSFGSTLTPPSTYHPNTAQFSYSDPVTGVAPSGNALAMVYDWGHDGWTVGTPPYMGDYTLPGSPFEGWAIQVNGVRTDAFFTDAGYNNTLAPAGSTLSGNVTSYSNTGGVIQGVWQGTAGPGGALSINQTYTIDTEASAVVITVKLKNTGSAPLNNIFYLRTTDTDNDEPWSGSGCSGCGFPTNDFISHQNDANHRVTVSSTGLGYPAIADYLGLTTKDCRAKACIIQSWPPPLISFSTPADTLTLDKIYNETVPSSFGSYYYALGTATLDQDIAIGLIYNVGTIASGQSAVISYAYIYGDSTTTDTTFPEPKLVIDGVAYDSVDTFNTCHHAGNSLPVSIINGNDRDWAMATWHWSPSGALSSDTGLNNNAIYSHFTQDTMTFTVTGTAGIGSCLSKTFHFTVILCYGAASNIPCEGDTLRLYGLSSDTTPATYTWIGPNDYYAVGQYPIRPFVSYADTGVYTLIRYGIGRIDTAHTTVHIYPKPILNITTNSPICNGGTANFTVNPDSTGETFLWTGPNGFTSTDQSPSAANLNYSDTGSYMVIGTTIHGCVDSNRTNLQMIYADINTFSDTIVCLIDSLPIRDSITVSPFNAPYTIDYSWTPGTGLGDTTSGMPRFNAIGTFNYLLTATIQPYGCVFTDALTIHSLPPTPVSNVTASQSVPYGASVQLNAGSEVIYRWIPADGTLNNSNISNPIATPQITTTYTVYGYDTLGCIDSAFVTLYVIEDTNTVVPSAFSPDGDGHNDVFRPFNLRSQRLVEMRIFNRWGQEVFYTTDREKGWDGTFHGVQQDIGVYQYMVITAQPSDGKNTVYKGDFTLIR